MVLTRRLAVGVGVALCVLALWGAGAFRWLHLQALDAGFALRPSPPPMRDIVVVGIDNASLKTIGSLPWPRTRYAEAISRLNSAGAEQIAFDMWFADPSAQPDEDRALAEALGRAGNVLLAVHANQQEATVRFTRNLPPLAAHAREAHVNVRPDADGKLRVGLWELHTLDERFLFLPLELAARRMGTPPEDIRGEAGRLRVGNRLVPLLRGEDGAGFFLLDLPSTSLTDNYISFGDVISGQFDPKQVRGKAVVIGQVVLGGANADVWNTPRGRKFGAVILAETAQQILDGRFLMPASPWLTAAITLLTALVGAVLFDIRHPLRGWLGHAALLIAVWGAFFLCMGRAGFILEPVPLTAGLVLTSGFGVALSLRQARRQILLDARAMEILGQLGETVITAGGMPAIVTGHHPDISDSLLFPAQTPRILLETICRALGAQAGRLYLTSPSGGLARAASVGEPQYLASDEAAARVNDRVLYSGGAFATVNAPRNLKLSNPACPRTLLAVPLALKGQVAGVIQLYGKDRTGLSPGGQFGPSDLRLAAGMAQQALVGLENATLYDGMRQVFINAVMALARAVDAKDPYTHGHSERVHIYSERLARALQLPERDVQVTRLAAIVHDIGKIAIPDAILRKPGRLTPEEFEVIQTHPVRGEGILAPLEELRPLAPAIRHHHERYDGAGYPDGLRSEEIPLSARIICVADSFDAITSQRYYRSARTLAEGLLEIERCAGSQFDPDLARVFVAMMRQTESPADAIAPVSAPALVAVPD